MNGFLCVIKPPGMTSAQVVGRMKRLFPGDKIGHGGTLDPQTAGVLPIMIGKATRLFDYLLDKQKEYIGEITFGISTDTQDNQGTALCRSTQYPTWADIEKVLPLFMGEIQQQPPAYSALKVQGRRAYDLARAGEEVTLAPRKITIYNLETLWYEEPKRLGIKVSCSKGTYIRTLCQDIGEKAGCPAHMSFLLRSQSGPFTLKEGKTLEEISKAFEEQSLEQHLLPLDFPIQHMPLAYLPSTQRENFMYGRPMNIKAFAGLDPAQSFRLYSKQGNLLGIGAAQGDYVKLKTFLQGIEA